MAYKNSFIKSSLIALLFGLLVVIGVYASFPLWISWVISQQLPEEMSLISVETDYPGSRIIFVQHLEVQSGDQKILIENLSIDYQKTDIKAKSITIEFADSDSNRGNEFSKIGLPKIDLEDFYKINDFNKVFIEALVIKNQNQLTKFDQVKLVVEADNLFVITFQNKNQNNPVIYLKGRMTLGTNNVQFSIEDMSSEKEQLLANFNYSVTDSDVSLKGEFDVDLLKRYLPPNDYFESAPLQPIEKVSFALIQHTQLLKSFIKSKIIFSGNIFDIELSLASQFNNNQLSTTVQIQASNISRLYYPTSGAEISSDKLLLNFSSQVDIDNLFTTKSTLNMTEATLQLVLGEVVLEKVPLSKDSFNVIEIEQVNIETKVKDFNSDITNIAKYEWDFSTSLIAKNVRNKSGLENDENLKFNASINANIDTEINFNQFDNSISTGNIQVENLLVSTADLNFESQLKIEFKGLNPFFNKGNAEVFLHSPTSELFELKVEELDLNSYIEFTENLIMAKGNVNINQQLLAPFVINYEKKSSDLSITLLKNKLANEMINSFLLPFSEQQQMPFKLKGGDISHTAKISLDKDFNIESLFNINDISFNFGENNVYGMHLRQKVTSLSPIKLSSNLTIESINFSSGLELIDISADVNSIADARYQASAIKGKLLNGELSAESIIFSAKEIELSTAKLKNISLTELVFFLDVQGLYAEGELDLSLPLALKEGALRIKEGTFNSTKPGIIKYSYGSDTTVDAESENIAIRALKNFHYQTLDGTLSYDELGQYHVKIHLLGANPDLYDGYPVDFTLNLRGQLSGVFRSLFLTGDFEQAIMEQIKSSDLGQ